MQLSTAWIPRKERHTVRAQAFVECADGRRAEAWILDMSDGGCRLETPKPLAVGERVRIGIERLGFIDAEVRWVKLGSAGLRFIGHELLPAHRAA